MNYVKVSFICRLETEAQFSAWKGSMLRGAMGTNLRRGLCMSRKEDCASCMLSSGCVFPRLFCPLPKGSKSSPPPFCLEPDLEQKTAYAAGDSFGFDLLLFSYAIEYLPFYVQAFRMAGEKGLGSSRLPGRFTVESVLCQTVSIYDKDKDKLRIPACIKLPVPSPLPDAGESRLDLDILTPLRFKRANQFSSSLDFPSLFNLVLRRISSLKLLDDEDWRMDPGQFAFMQAEAKKIRLIENNLKWQDLGRYSSRQDSLMKFGGLSGKISYAGSISIFKEFLNFAKIAHIGKQTSFGLGMLNFNLDN